MKKIKSASDKALEVIKKGEIKPIPQWEFNIRNRLIWAAFGISILTGAVAVSVLIYMIQSNDWDLYYFPYFWLVIFLILLGLAYFSFRKTKKGYKLEFIKVGGLAVGLSMLLGVILSGVEVGSRIDLILARDIPVYRQIAPMKVQKWVNPEEGFLAGEISRVNSKIELELTDFNGEKWIVELDDPTIRGGITIDKGRQIKIIGKKMESNRFIAKEIRPWEGGCMGQGEGCGQNERKGR